MIGFTLDPGASGVIIDGVDVWKPGSFSAAGAAPTKTSAHNETSAANVACLNKLSPFPQSALLAGAF
jgi:hypothetical protein